MTAKEAARLMLGLVALAGQQIGSGRTAMSLILQRRGLYLGRDLRLALTGVQPGAGPPCPPPIVDQTPIGRDKMLVVHEDTSGRIIAADSSSYLVKIPTQANRCDRGRLLSAARRILCLAVLARRQGDHRDRCRHRQGRGWHQWAQDGEGIGVPFRRDRRDVGGNLEWPLDAAWRDQPRQCAGARARRCARTTRL